MCALPQLVSNLPVQLQSSASKTSWLLHSACLVRMSPVPETMSEHSEAPSAVPLLCVANMVGQCWL